MTSMRSGLLTGAALSVLLAAAAAKAEEAAYGTGGEPLIVAQAASGEATPSDTPEELAPVEAAEKSVEDARTALRQAMATGGDVRGARRDLQAAIKTLNEIREQAGLEPSEDKVEEPEAAEAPPVPETLPTEPPAAAAPQPPPTLVLPQTPPATPPTLAVPQTPPPELPTLAEPTPPSAEIPPAAAAPPPEPPALAVPIAPPPAEPPQLAPSPAEPQPEAATQPSTLTPPTPAPGDTAIVAPPATVAPPAGEEQKAEEQEEPGFFRRLFGGGKKPENPEGTEQAAAPPSQQSSETATTEKPSLQIFKDLPPIEGPKIVTVAPEGSEVVEQEDEKRVIVREDGQMTIKHDDNDRFRRRGEEIKVEEGQANSTVTTVKRPNGTEVITVRNASGDILQRYRKDKNGEIEILIGDRDLAGRPRQQQNNLGPRSGPGNGFDFSKTMPKLRIQIPQDQYIVGSQGASRSKIEQALVAPPVEAIERAYSLEEIRRSERLRAKLRRIDVDTVNFEFGADTIAEDQVPQLQAMGNALAAIISDDPNEVFLIEGHTDAVGSDLANLGLSDRRAESIAVILTYYFDIPPENLVTQGYGEQYLKVLTATPERLNRRVSVRRITPLLVGQL
jgi:outer membrane protein OmpA-like peptidoglycan-associated protein